MNGFLQVAGASAAYFGFVFGTGFVLGVLRVLFILPQLGERWAELTEMPLMVLAIVFAARWLTRRPSDGRISWLAVGGIAVGFVLMADMGVGVGLRGLSPIEALVQKDPVSGTAYYLALVLFGLMPWLVTRRRAR